MPRTILILAAFLNVGALSPNVSAALQDDVKSIFQQYCAGCHGANAQGGDRAPSLVKNPTLLERTDAQIHDLIKNGSRGGMPAFALPEDDLKALTKWVRSLNLSALEARPGGDLAAGEQFFFGKGRCSECHMVHGRGKPNGPDLSNIGRRSTVREIADVLADPTSQMGTHPTSSCPSFAFCPDESWRVINVRLHNGTSLRGFLRHQGKHDLQLQTFDGRLLSLTDTNYEEVLRENSSYMPALQASEGERRNLVAYLSTLGGSVTGPLSGSDDTVSPDAIHAILHPHQGDWPTYNGVLSGNRYSSLDQINNHNVGSLQLQWVYSLNSPELEMTPLVSGGVMYVTAPGRVCALDARSGTEIWCYLRSEAAAGPLGSQPNRGVALLGDRVFFATDSAHLLCLNRLTGGVVWDINMVDSSGRYTATSAPLVVGDLVISGIAGGDAPLRGFLAAYNALTGREVWRFWTIPKPGDPGSETWQGKAIESGGGATWLTGSYDVETETLYWAVGNPFPATDGDDRDGTNLYTNCVVALNASDGKLKWYYQFTPHDLHDWDATEPLLLVDAPFHGVNRKLLLQADRNGFFYVLDRTNGELLLAKPFVRKLNWASGIGADGKPQVLPANRPSRAGTKTCPAVRGATNWYSSSFSPVTKLFYFMAVEDCSVYRQSHDGGYEGVRDPADAGQRFLRALDIETGSTAWQIPQFGSTESNYSGVLATAGGVLFYGESGGEFTAVDSKTGRWLWGMRTNAVWRASPITYSIEGRQYVAIAAGTNLLSFAVNVK